MLKIWVDDERPAPEGWIAIQTSQFAIAVLKGSQTLGETVEAISLDHDLGGEDTTRPIVIWMIENDYWPLEINVHSANPVGVEWLEGMIERYRP